MCNSIMTIDVLVDFQPLLGVTTDVGRSDGLSRDTLALAARSLVTSFNISAKVTLLLR